MAGATHVAVDCGSKEGCVYAKFATPADAGRAYAALHGWWHCGALVTAKFVREERYHQRFPTARHATGILVPENSEKTANGIGGNDLGGWETKSRKWDAKKHETLFREDDYDLLDEDDNED